MSALVLNERELRQCVQLGTGIIDEIERGFIALARGEVVMPPILRLDVQDHNGEMDVKTAYVRGVPRFALKVSCGFFDNPRRNLPSLSGMMTLLSAETGYVEAVLLDNGYLTDVRTAAAGAVAARHLAPKAVEVAGVIGAGTQARLQILALALVRPFKRLQVWARDQDKASKYADEMRKLLPGVTVTVSAEPRAVVEAADVLVTTTPAKSPVVQAEWLHPGLHITAMGSDAEEKNEIAAAAFRRANLIVCDHLGQCKRLGELHHAFEAGALAADAPVTELGRIAAGEAPGRVRESDISICDLTGTGVQDTMIAVAAFQKALASGFGVKVET